MRLAFFLTALHFFLFGSSLLAQNKEKTEIERIKSLNKAGIVELALELIDRKIEYSDYYVEVKANSEHVLVSFAIPIKYLPLSATYRGDILVNLINERVRYRTISNSKKYVSGSYHQPFLYYKTTEETKKHIDFVKKALKKDNTLGSVRFDDSKMQNYMTVREKGSHYDVEIYGQDWEAHCIVDKVTGNLSNVVTASIESDPDEDEDSDPFIEITK